VRDITARKRLDAGARITCGEELARFHRLVGPERQHLPRPGSRTVDRHALEPEPPALAVGLGHLLGARVHWGVDGRGDRVIDVALERLLHGEMPMHRDLRRGDEQVPQRVGEPGIEPRMQLSHGASVENDKPVPPRPLQERTT
jgi:hypothetical protein